MRRSAREGHWSYKYEVVENWKSFKPGAAHRRLRARDYRRYVAVVGRSLKGDNRTDVIATRKILIGYRGAPGCRYFRAAANAVRFIRPAIVDLICDSNYLLFIRVSYDIRRRFSAAGFTARNSR